MKNYTEEQQTFLAKRKVRIDDARAEGPRGAKYIAQGKGSFSGCLSTLELHHWDLSGYAWFHDHDLREFKQQCYVVSKLYYIQEICEGGDHICDESQFYYALLSDYEPAIRWMVGREETGKYNQRDMDNPGTSIYRWHQMALAVQGNWEVLRQRAEKFLADIPKQRKKWAVDMRYYLALSQGDTDGMVAALQEISQPKILKARKEHDYLLFASQFISPFAALYAKIARRHGYVLDIDTPMIPAEWIPVEPLPAYPDPYPFLSKYSFGVPGEALY